MIDQIKKLVNNKNVLILGFGREGRSTYKLLKSIDCYNKLAIADINDYKKDVDVDFYSGDDYINHIKDYDIVFKTPGIVIDEKVDIGDAYITSGIEQFIIRYNKQIIGITGTKGKSTTSSLIYHILKSNNFDTIFAGNIGIPVFDIINEINNNTIIVIELSSHQLEYCKSSPHISIFLNIYEEHLDHYKDFEAYYNAKKNIYKYQNSDDLLFCDKKIKEDIKNIKSKIEVIDKNILPNININNLKGEHNLYNISFAYKISKLYDIPDDKFLEALSIFKPLPHRLEYIGEKDNIKYYDDSISTAAESCIEAIKSINDISTILIGGMDRGINYDKLIDYLKLGHVENIICMYATGKRIYDKLIKLKLDNINIYFEDDLEKSVLKAKAVTNKNKSCVLSPAAASYGYFKNFEERGDKFKQYVFR